MKLPLSGIKVFDFSHLLPGELCGTILSDLGAEVLRVEPLDTPLGQTIPPVVKNESLFYWSLHRHQKRIALNLKSPRAIEIVNRMVPNFDVLVENFRPGVMERLGIGYDAIAKLHRRIIYCSISGYGHSTSVSQKPGHDLNFVAEAGILSRNIRPGQRPVQPVVLVSDYTSAMYAALGIVSALFQRNTNGENEGTHLDISMFESALSSVGVLATSQLYDDEQARNFQYPLDAPNYCIYECQDGRFLAVAALESQFWKTFCATIDLPELISARVLDDDPEIYKQVASAIKSKPLSEWRRIFADADCCVSPVNTVEEAFNEKPAREKKLLSIVSHPSLGKISQLASPLFRAAERDCQASTDRAGETARTLRELGYSDDQLKDLASQNVILELN